MRLSSLTACGTGAAAELASKVRALKADAVVWITESSQPAKLAVALADSAESVVGAVTTQGLIGGGGEHSRSLGSASMPGVPYSFSPSPEAERTVALAISGLSGGASLLPWHSPPDGLPDLPEAFWTDHAVASPEMSPHLLLLAAPPSSSSFGVERWLGRLDSALPWATKVGGLTVGDSRFFVGATEHDGGGVGLALCGVDLEPLVCQGARPVGPSFSITESDGNVIRALDGMEVTAALEPVLKEFSSVQGDLMAGVSVPVRPAAVLPAGAAASAGASASPYVVRAVLGYSRRESALAVGTNPELLEAPDARLQLHAFSADHARQELRASAAALTAATGGGAAPAGGLMVSCVGRGAALYGEEGVESAVLQQSMGSLALAGFFAGGEIGPVGARTFVHTYTTTVGLLRARG